MAGTAEQVAASRDVSAQRHARRSRRSSERRNLRGALLFISPWIIGFLVFTAWPVIYSGYLSLTDYDVINAPTFIGLDNYRQMLEDPKVSQALWNTFVFTVIKVPLHIVVSLALAL